MWSAEAAPCGRLRPESDMEQQPPKSTVRVTIDGRPLDVDPAKTILQAALDNGIQIPYFCWHPYLSTPGNCRQCQVKVEKMPKLVVSCNTRVGEGMVVDTQGEEVRRAQATNMEFLLINHPLDCPICDQVGECWLQEHAFTAGPGQTRFRENKVHFDKRVDIGPHVLLDKERCIKCTRCIRFCDEVTRTSELALFARSDHTEVDIFPGRPLDNPYSGNVVDICPVGALTLKEFRFRSRLWFLRTQESVCPGCARGCSIKVWHRDGGVARITPRDNPEVNKAWICDEGRLIGDALAGRERVKEPASRPPAGEGGAAAVLRRREWPDALGDAAAVLRSAAGRVALAVGTWATQEETKAALDLIAGLSGGHVEVAVPRHERGADDDLLIRADKTPNRRGVLSLIEARGGAPIEMATMVERAARGELRALLVLREDLFDAGVPEAAVEAALRAGLRLVVIAAHRTRTTDRAAVLLPAATFPEMDGTWINVEGREQSATAAYPPPFLARPGARILADLTAARAASPAP
jgi:NADH-quinone oxidoreductase subunit G